MGTCLALAPSTLAAQRGAPQVATIEFGRPNDTGDGYVNARIDVHYQFADCEGDVRVLYRMDRENVRVSGGYYYRGKWYQVPASVAAPRPSVIDFSGPILNRGGLVEGSFSDPYTQGGAGSGCLGQAKNVFTRKQKMPAGSTAEQYAAFLQGLWIRPRTQPRLRDDAAERWILGELAKQRDDSLARLAKDRERDDSAKARRGRELARQDSIERSRAADKEREARDLERDNTARDSAWRDDERKDADDKARQDAEDREAQRQRDQNASDQTARLNAMFAVEKLQWERAEAAYARGDYATARPIYEELAGSLVYSKMAKDRLNTLNSQQVAEGVVATLTLLNQLQHAVREALHGTNLAVGGAYAQNGFPGAKGDAGLTFGYVARPMQRWVPYFDFTFGLGNDESKAERYYPNKSFGGVVMGTTVPRLKMALGSRASLSPHIGYRWMVTDLRDVHVGQTGLTLIVPGMMLRGDAVIINGKPQLGGAISRIF